MSLVNPQNGDILTNSVLSHCIRGRVLPGADGSSDMITHQGKTERLLFSLLISSLLLIPFDSGNQSCP